jgi:hypothetical protein
MSISVYDDPPGRARRLLRRATALLGGAVLCLVVGLAMHAPTARAVLVPDPNNPAGSPTSSAPPANQPDDSGGPTGGSGGCAYLAWTMQPKLVIHVSEFYANGGSFGMALQLLSEVNNAVNQFNAVGGTAARVTSVTTSTAPFVYGKPFNDGAIHLGFASGTDFSNIVKSKGLSTDTTAMTLPMVSKSNPCELGEAQILFPAVFQPDVTKPGGWFPNQPGFMWSFETPYTTGVSYYDAGPGYGLGFHWFRPSFLHELLHAYGLVHTKTMYAMMNHAGTGGFPWANRPSTDAVRPLPYDDYLLRTRYPATGSSWDVAVLGTGMEPPSDPTNDAGDQIKLCSPSTGISWAGSYSSGTCGVDGKNNGGTTACAGTTLYTRYTLANYSTSNVKITTTLSLSKDETWDIPDPVAGTLTGTNTVDYLAGSTSVTMGRTWTAPALASGVSYHPIVHIFAEHVNADGSIDPASLRIDSIPLRGLITGGAKVGKLCQTYAPAP